MLDLTLQNSLMGLLDKFRSIINKNIPNRLTFVLDLVLFDCANHVGTNEPFHSIILNYFGHT
jgi:hypothetical protein